MCWDSCASRSCALIFQTPRQCCAAVRLHRLVGPTHSVSSIMDHSVFQDDDEISNITFSGDESNGAKYDLKDAHYYVNERESTPRCQSANRAMDHRRRVPKCDEVWSLTGASARYSRQKGILLKPSSSSLPVFASKGRKQPPTTNPSVKHSSKHSTTMSIQTKDTSTISAKRERVNASSIIINDAQRKAAARARGHVEEERKKPSYKGKIHRHGPNNAWGKEKTVPVKHSKQWDCAAPTPLDKGTSRIRNMVERNATILEERREQQLERMKMKQEKVEMIKVEAKEALQIRMEAKRNTHGCEAFDRRPDDTMLTTDPMKHEETPRKRQERQFIDRSDGEIARTFAVVQVAPSKPSAISCYRTRSTSPFNMEKVANVLNATPTTVSTVHQSPAKCGLELRERQVSVLRKIEEELEQIRLNEACLQLEDGNSGAHDAVQVTQKIDVNGKYGVHNTSEVVNETDAVSWITLSPVNHEKETATDKGYLTVSQNLRSRLDQYLQGKHRERNDGYSELHKSKIIEM